MRHPYADFLARVERPSRYIGGEYHQVKKPADGVDARICLAFPDVYEIGMSHLGTKILYGLLNRHPRIACERAFAPWLDCEAELRARGLELVTLESAAPLSGFDVLGFSLQYELTYTNVLNILDLAGVPLRAVDRGDAAPLILCGGPTATHPEPLAPFIDAFFIGEAEEHLPGLVLEAAKLRREGVPRVERLVRLAAAFPIYVPELYETERDPETGMIVVGQPRDARVPARVKRAWIKDINEYPFPDDSPLPYGEAIFDRMAVEIARGCTEGCRFCQAGMIYRPVRERDPVAVVDALVAGVKKGGYDETSLTSLSTADYSCVTPLVKTAMAKLRDEKVSLSVSSLRAYGLGDDLLAEMATMRAGGLTFAPEAGTQRMRDVITKNVTEDDISESAHRVFSRGFQRMKLYFMIGLPTETDEDVRGIIETAARVQAIGRRYLAAAKVTASVSIHVPKPHTPFQWAAMDSEEDIARKQALLVSLARQHRVELKMHDGQQSILEALFSRGDREIADALERAFRLGCRFDGWDDQLKLELWERALEDEAPHHRRYLPTLPVTAKLAWDHIDIALEPDFLLKEYRKALKDRLSPPCGKPYKKLLHPKSVAEAEAGKADKLICYDCGVACDLDGMKAERLTYLRRMNAWTAPPAPPPPARKQQSDGAARPKRAAPVTSIHQGSAHRIRLRYTKLGRVAYLGHLDLVRHLPRIFRRADVGIYYSIGYHPKPELSFGPALGLGIPSFGEMLDVKLAEPVPADELVERLQAVTLDGVEWLGGGSLGDNDRALGRVIARAELWARLPAGVSGAPGVDAWQSAQPLLVTRTSESAQATDESRQRTARPGRPIPIRRPPRTIDLRQALATIEAVDATTSRATEVCRTLGWDDLAGSSDRLVRFDLAISHDGTAKPTEVIEAIWGADVAADTDFARIALWAVEDDQLIDPLNIPRLRRNLPPPPSASSPQPGVAIPSAAVISV